MGDHPGESPGRSDQGVKGRNRVADIGLKAIEKRVRYLSAEEEKRLRAALRDRDDRIRTGRASVNEWREARGVDLKPTFAGRFVDYLEPAVLVSMHTGLRQGELLQLTWSCVDLNTKMIR